MYFSSRMITSDFMPVQDAFFLKLLNGILNCTAAEEDKHIRFVLIFDIGVCPMRRRTTIENIMEISTPGAAGNAAF